MNALHKTFMFIVGFWVIIVVSSCARKSTQLISNDTLRFEATNFINLSELAAANQIQFYVENADLYELMIGKIISEVADDSIKNKPIAISEIELTSVSLSKAYIQLPFDADSAEAIVNGGSLKLQHPALSDYESLILADFNQVNLDSNRIDFLFVTQPDLATHITNNLPDRMYFDLELDRMPSSTLRANYVIEFEFNYSYKVQKQ